MITIEAECWISGPEFSPEKARERSGLRIPDGSEPGAPTKRPGNPPRPHGHASIRLEDEGLSLGEEDAEERLLALVERHGPALREAGATKFDLRLYVEYEGPCNMHFPADFLARLGKLGMHLSISCYEGEDD